MVAEVPLVNWKNRLKESVVAEVAEAKVFREDPED